MSLNLLKEKEITKKYRDHEFYFKIREIGGYESDQIFDDSKKLAIPMPDKNSASSDDVKHKVSEKAEVTFSMAELSKHRISSSVIESKLDGNIFDINKELRDLPKTIYKWLCDEIVELESLSVEEGKKNPELGKEPEGDKS